MMRKKLAGIVGMVMLLLIMFASFASTVWALDRGIYDASNWKNWEGVQIDTIFSDWPGEWRRFGAYLQCFMTARLIIYKVNEVDFNLQCNGKREIDLSSDHLKGAGSNAGKSGNEIVTLVGQRLGASNEKQVRAEFSKARAGDLVQFYRSSSSSTGEHTFIISGFYEDGVDVLHGGWYQTDTICNQEFTYAKLASWFEYSDAGFSIYRFGNPIPDLQWDGSTVLLNRYDFPIKVYTLENRTYDVYSDKYLRNKLASNWTDGSEEDWILDVGKNSEGVDYAYISIPLNNGNRKSVYVNLRDVFVKGSLNEPTHVYKDCRDFYRRRGSDYDSSYVLIADNATIFPLTRDNGWVQVCFWDWGENGGARIAWLTASEYTRITTDDSVTPPTITTSSLPDAYIGKSYSATLTATGTTPITYECNGATAMSYGFLLDGKNFAYTSTNGLINGTITNPTSHSTPFTVNINVTASNAGGSCAKTLPVTIYDLPSISYTFKDSKTGQSYSDYVTVSGGKSPYTWTKQSGTLPDGLSMSPSGSNLYLKGTPTKAGTYNFSLKVKDANGKTATKSFTVTITASATIPSIMTSSLADGTVGTSYSATLSATGTTPISWSATGLPSGLSCSSAGKITGTPASAGTYSVKITAKNTAGSVSKTLTLTIKGKVIAPTIITTSLPDGGMSLPDGRVDESYSVTLSATGTTPITWSATGLPPGLSCSSSGTISGTPTQAVTFSVTVTATNTAGSTSETFILTIMRRATAPTITTTSLPSGKVSTSYSATLSATGTTPITWSASGLPGGVSCSSSGAVTGTPASVGTYSVKVTATNTAGSASKTFYVNIAPGGSSIETPEYEAQPIFRTQSLLLSGQIGLNFYMELPSISGVNYSDKDCYMDFSIDGKSGGALTPQPYDPEFMNAQKTYYGFRCYLNSIQMADNVTATFHYGDGKTVTKSYSAKQYIDTALGTAGFSEAVKNLMSAMKDYGHYMQIFLSQSGKKFNIGTDHAEMECVNVYTDSDISEAAEEAANYKAVYDTSGTGIKKLNYSLVLDSETALNIYLTLTDEYKDRISQNSAETQTPEVGDEIEGVYAYLDGSGENLAVLQKDGRYLVQISGISAHKLGDTYTVTVHAGGTFTAKISAMSYVDAVLSSGVFGSDGNKGVTSLYRYYKATMAYRESTAKK